MAQSASITTTQTSYNYGETVVIQYEGAANGDKILFYQDLSMLPLKVCFSLSEPNGTCKVESLLEPGRYKAQIVDAADVATAEVQFIVNHATLPTGGKKIFLFSDPHVMSPDLVEAPNSPSYIRDVADSRKLMAYSAELFDAVIDSIKTMIGEQFGNLKVGGAAIKSHTGERITNLDTTSIDSTNTDSSDVIVVI
jgi:hypothetical protein